MILPGVVGNEIGICVMFEPCIIVCTFLLYFDLNICRKWSIFPGVDLKNVGAVVLESTIH